MKIVTVAGFRNQATKLIRSSEPILVLRYSRLVGVFYPWTGAVLSFDLKRRLKRMMLAELHRDLRMILPRSRDLLGEFLEWTRRRQILVRRRSRP